MIEQKPKSIQAIYKELESTIKEYGVIDKTETPILGCNDEVLVLENIPWAKFLKHYMDGTGCLNHSSKIYANNLVGVTTIIGAKRITQNKGGVGENLKVQKLKENSSKTSEISCSKCDALIQRFRSIEEEYPNIRKSVIQILCSLRKFENEHFPPYLYTSLINSVSMMVDILEEATKNGLKDNAAELFFQCQKAFYLSIQNTARVDRQFTQTPDFDMRMYDVPTKLVMFFIAYINAIKEYLCIAGTTDQEEPHKYEFLFCPGGAYNTQVTELFQMISENSRMFLVEIPEHQIYDIKLILIMLGHEVAHIVGKGIRNRSERKKRAVTITAKIVVSYMENALKTWEAPEWKECVAYICNSDTVWSEIEKEIACELNKFLEEENLREYLKGEYQRKGRKTDSETGIETALDDKIERLIKRGEYSTELSYLLAKGLQQILEKQSDTLWERIKYRSEDYLSGNSKSDFQKNQYHLQEKIHEITRKIVIGDQIDAEVFSAINTIGMMMNVFSESFADLTVVLLTGMSWRDYISAAITCQKQMNFPIETKKDSEWLLRMGLVVACMDRPNGGKKFGDWKIEDFGDGKESGEKEVQTALYNFVKTYFYENEGISTMSSNSNKPREIISGLSVLYNADILKEMLRYLMECKHVLKKSFKPNRKMLNKIRKMYQLFGNDCNVQDELIKMQGYIDAYASNVAK